MGIADKRKQVAIAEMMYIIQGKTVAQISAEVDYCEREIFRWAKEGEWKRRRQSVEQTGWSAVEKLKAQIPVFIDKMNAEPNPQTADALLKVVTSLRKLRKEADIVGSALVVMKKLAIYLRGKDQAAAEIVSDYIDGFIDELIREQAE